MHIEETWGVNDVVQDRLTPPEGWSNNGRRVVCISELVDWPEVRSMPWIVNVGGKRLPACDQCLVRGAIVYCENDEANLCNECNEQIHCSSILERHRRVPISDIEVVLVVLLMVVVY